MKYLLNAIFITAFSISIMSSSAQKNDTLNITAHNLEIKNIKQGKSTYIVYNKKSKDSPSERITLVKINVEAKLYNEKPSFAITQQWEMDTLVHSAYTVLSATDFSTILHDFYWKRLGYSAKFDFVNKSVSYNGAVSDSAKTISLKDFNESFDKYNLNWHSDLIIFTLLPYKENRVFKINFFDPGFGKAEDVLYSVTGSDFLTNSSGEQIKCWTLEHKLTPAGYQKFWISQKTKEVLKEEDSFNGRSRYKFKLGVSEAN